MKRCFWIGIFTVKALLITCGVSVASSHEVSQITAVPADPAPTIDGNLGDIVWQRAIWFDRFVQKRPVNGAEPRRKTAFAVAYDDRALYFAIRCHVNNKKEIITRLVRRDREADFDNVEVTLSPREDGRTGYSFAVNPSGVKRDKYWSDDTKFDAGWDAVWEAETGVTHDAWIVEMKIPLDQMRFTSGNESYGLQVGRWMSKLKEWVLFSPVPDDKQGSVSTAGKLLGVGEVEARLPMSINPESYVSYATTTSGYDSRRSDGLAFGGGGYAKIGLRSDVVLDMAVLPDFGQVEVDDVVLNLSAYETQFPEKRPFFLEGAGLFSTPYQLFYSRRMGQAPPEPDLDDDESVVHGHSLTPILSAARVTGRTRDGVTFGVLDAVYLPTEFLIQNDVTGVRRYAEGSPWTNAAAVRTIAELGSSSTVGLLATALNPSDTDGSYTAGVDWNALSRDKEFAFRGQVAGSMRFDGVLGKDAANGTGFWAQIGREGGEPFRYRAIYDFRSEDFNINDMGYINRGDLHRYVASVDFLKFEAPGVLKEFYAGIGGEGKVNTDGVMLNHSAWIWVVPKWRNHWSTVGSIWGTLAHYDDIEPRGGPPLRRPANGGMNLTISSPTEKSIGFDWVMGVSSKAFGYGLSLAPTFHLRLGRLDMSLTPKVVRSVGGIAYVDTLNEDLPNEITVVGRRSMTELNLSLKGTLLFTRDLSLQMHAQLLSAGVNYSHYAEVLKDGTTQAMRYQDEDGNPQEGDFSRTDLVLQGLLRWEYLPGSELFVIYTHRGFMEITDTTYRVTDTLTELEDEEREQLIMLKLSHRFG